MRVFLLIVSAVATVAAYRVWIPLIGMAAPVGAITYCFSWIGLLNGTEIFPNPWAAILALATTGLVARRVEGGDLRHAILAAVTIGGLALIRPTEAIALGAAIAIWILVFRRNSWRVLAGLGAGLALGWLPWIVEMSVRFGGPIGAFEEGASAGQVDARTGVVENVLVHLAATDGRRADLGAPVAGIVWWVMLGVVAAIATRARPAGSSDPCRSWRSSVRSSSRASTSSCVGDGPLGSSRRPRPRVDPGQHASDSPSEVRGSPGSSPGSPGVPAAAPASLGDLAGDGGHRYLVEADDLDGRIRVGRADVAAARGRGDPRVPDATRVADDDVRLGMRRLGPGSSRRSHRRPARRARQRGRPGVRDPGSGGRRGRLRCVGRPSSSSRVPPSRGTSTSGPEGAASTRISCGEPAAPRDRADVRRDALSCTAGPSPDDERSLTSPPALLDSVGLGTDPGPTEEEQLAGARREIEHVVFIIKENRTFDHFFGRFPGANGATHGYTWTVPASRSEEPRRMPSGPSTLHRRARRRERWPDELLRPA